MRMIITIFKDETPEIEKVSCVYKKDEKEENSIWEIQQEKGKPDILMDLWVNSSITIKRLVDFAIDIQNKTNDKSMKEGIEKDLKSMVENLNIGKKFYPD